MRLAHFSDPHILDLTGVGPSRLLLNKRVTGAVNLFVLRKSKHRPFVVESMMDDIRAQRVDHVAITGDLTNLALEPEFARAKEVFARMGLPADRVSVVPGNHDLYTGGARRTQRFASFFREHITSDLPIDTEDSHPSGPFPYVRLRGPVAIIGLSTAVPRLPLVSSGYAGRRQLELLAEILDHAEVKSRTPVLLMHHPLVNPGHVLTLLRGFLEASKVRALLERCAHSLVLHGHLHERVRHEFHHAPSNSRLHHMGATSASLMHHDRDRGSGYNVYDIGPRGLERAHARVYDPVGAAWIEREL